MSNFLKKPSKGKSEKLVYHFPTEKNLEIQMKSGEWARVTCKTFRSFAGNRRVNEEIYEGPILYFETNYLYEGELNGMVVGLNGSAEGLKKVTKRTRFSYSNEWDNKENFGN
tara:strand:+ start:82 stop:417 length:336 start_codon:yes stop_codon:yes gene_type:complete